MTPNWAASRPGSVSNRRTRDPGSRRAAGLAMAYKHIAKYLGVSRATFYRYVSEHGTA